MENYIFIKCLEFYFDFNEMFQALFLCLLLLGTQGVGLNFFNYRKLASLSEGQTFKSCLDSALDQSGYFVCFFQRSCWSSLLIGSQLTFYPTELVWKT